jgi:hypothetical protein
MKKGGSAMEKKDAYEFIHSEMQKPKSALLEERMFAEPSEQKRSEDPRDYARVVNRHSK